LRDLEGDHEMKELVRAEEQQCKREIDELEVCDGSMSCPGASYRQYQLH